VALAGGTGIAVVAKGRKPIYHEEWGKEIGCDLAGSKIAVSPLRCTEPRRAGLGKHGRLFYCPATGLPAVCNAGADRRKLDCFALW